MGDYAATKDDHYYRLDHRSYSFAEAMNCHDFDLTEPSQNVNVSAYKPTIKHATEKNYDLPIDDAGLFSYLYFTWMSPLMKTAYKTGLQVTDLWGCAESDSAEFNCEKLHKLWSDELDIKGSAKASLVKVFLKFIKTEAIKATFSFVILDVAIFSTSLLIFALLDYIQGTEFNMPYALSLCLLLVIFDVVRSLSVSCGAVISLRAAVRLRSAILMISYKKMMSFCILHDQTVGEFVNLSTNDTQRIFEAVSSAVLLIAGPIMGIIIMIYTTVFLGPAGLIGSLIFFLMLPIQLYTSKLIASLRTKAIKITDQRVRVVNEMIVCIKLIKMYAWEIPFAEKVKGIRANEKQFLEKAAYTHSVNVSTSPVIQVTAIIVTFSVYVLTGNELTPATTYTVVGMYALARLTIVNIAIPLKAVSESTVAVQRIKKLLLLDEIKPYRDKPTDECVAIDITKATFSWDTQNERSCNTLSSMGKEETNAMLDEFTGNKTNALFDIDCTFKKGNLVGVCGSVGSGKSSLISAILSHMQLLSGKVAIDGSIAYVSQQAWICNATIKENILFGLPYDRHWYEKSIFAACLQDDLELLPRGSDTEIGERGVTLSGGQKQRISLARAMYARRDIYLLDDPLSAVDAHVGKHIFKYFIKEGLCGKTVMFITHQLQYLSVCDHILVLKDGKIVECGTHEQMMASGLDYAQLYNCYLSETSEPNNLTNGHSAQNDSVFSEEHPDLDTSGSLRQDAKSIIGKSNSVASIADTDSNYDPLMTIEDKSEGNVKWKTYHEYIQNAGGYLLASFTLFTFAAVFACMTASNWWLGYWMANTSTGSEVFNYTSSNMTGNSTDIITDTSETNVFVSIYLIKLGVLIVSTIVRVLIYVKTTLRASTRLHNKVFKVVFRAPMEFFDATPSGRILNRFSKDIDEVDVRLPMCMESMLNYAFIILFSLFSIIIVFPWYLLALLAFAVIFIVCYLYFHHALRELKRLDNITRSPWISHITTTIHGLSTIHAYGRTTQSIRKYAELVDANTVSLLLFCLSSRWVAVRLDVIAILSTFLTALMTVLSHGNIPSSYSGIALIYSVQFTGTFQLMVREMAECEARFTSVERILYYIKNLLAEAPSITDPRPPDDWPQQGVLEMKEVKMRYRDNLPLALNGISFKVDTMEKIGVVGRTGAGKSSLGTCLFRLVDTTSGDIYIDDVNIKTLGLHDLRSSISIIPQDPALFVGTIRYNLDPFNQYSDDDVWTALEKCYMKDTVRDIDGKLDGQVVECGGNFSVGERQLLCMARALLRNCKILILDEATAAIDTQTDSLIQQTIRDAFHGCTMLIIAHRLNTVLKCDKIMVMDKGMVVEFDTPSSLLQDPDSRFTSMMEAAEKI